MSITTRVAAGLFALSFACVVPALAADKNSPRSGCNQPGASAGTTSTMKPPEKIEGQVVAVDPARSMITIKDNAGSTHEFHANKDDMPTYKVGDHIEAKLRSAPNC